ncbi:MAG TPA: DUF2268 domain-containing putative Zn-dependent protease [Gemmatimonadales bacterium]
MLIDLVPEFLALLDAHDPLDAYRRYLDEHRLILSSYWRNYVLDLESPHAEDVIRRALGAERRDLSELLQKVDVAQLAGDALRACERVFRIDRPVDVYLTVGVGAANAGELVVAGRGIAFICLEHFTGRPNPETFGLGLDPSLIPLWVAHEIAHTVRYTSSTSLSEMARIVAEAGGNYDYWDSGSRATLRELLVNEGLAVAAAERVAPGFQPWEYLGYSRGQYRRMRSLDAFLRHAIEPELDLTGLGFRLRYLTGGMSPAQRLVAGKVVPERSGYYVGRRMVEGAVVTRGIAEALRLDARDIADAEDAQGAQSA